MPRLLLITTVPITMNAFLMPYVYHFRSLGWQVDGMANGISQNKQCCEAFDQIFEIDWSRDPIDPRNFLGRPQRIRSLIEREGYDIIHVHTPVAAFVTRFALSGLSEPKVIYTAHGFHFHEGGSILKNALFLALEKVAASWTDHLIVINRDDEESAKRHRLLPLSRIHYMPGIGVDTLALRHDTVTKEAVLAVREELGLGPGDQLFLMIAEFNPGKRHREAVAALAQMRRTDVHLAFAGTGPEESAIRELATECNVKARIHFLGWRSDVPALARASVATILPSEREGLPRSVMESMALSVPVIGTDIRGMRDLLIGGCGLLVPVGDSKRLSAAMEQVLNSPKEAAELGEHGRERIESFDVRHILKMHERLYLEALGHSFNSDRAHTQRESHL